MPARKKITKRATKIKMKVGGQDIWQWSAPHTGHDERMKNATYYVADIEYVHWANSFPMEWFIMFVNINVAMFYITNTIVNAG